MFTLIYFLLFISVFHTLLVIYRYKNKVWGLLLVLLISMVLIVTLSGEKGEFNLFHEMYRYISIQDKNCKSLELGDLKCRTYKFYIYSFVSLTVKTVIRNHCLSN